MQHISKNPMYQALLVFGVALTLAVIEKLANLTGLVESKPDSPWIVMTTFILFYSIANSVLSLRAENLNTYWAKSIISFVAILVCSAIGATLLSGLSIDEAGSFRWLFIVLTVGYLVFLSIMRLVKAIVEYAIKQDDELKKN